MLHMHEIVLRYLTDLVEGHTVSNASAATDGEQSVNCTRVIVDITTLCPHSSTVTIISAAMPKHGGFVVFLCLSPVSCCNHHKGNNTPL